LNATPTYFADTAFWIALAHRSDQYHGRASAWSRYLIQEDAFILTTEAVLWEWMNALAAAGTRRTTAEGYRRCHQDTNIEVVPFAPDTIAAALRFYEGRGDKDWSLTDCLSFLVMEQRRIARALTTDRHFQQAGFEALLLGNPPVAG
jgi:predicted nucleic acid-binding protein